jgi:hypothetical protein
LSVPSSTSVATETDMLLFAASSPLASVQGVGACLIAAATAAAAAATAAARFARRCMVGVRFWADTQVGVRLVDRLGRKQE